MTEDDKKLAAELRRASAALKPIAMGLESDADVGALADAAGYLMGMALLVEGGLFDTAPNEVFEKAEAASGNLTIADM
jgi:hypothetical protein